MHQAFFWLRFILTGLLWLGTITLSISQTVEKEKLMVAYIYSFTKNIEWSENKDVFRIQAVTNNGVLAKELTFLSNSEKIKGARIEIVTSSSSIISQQTDLVFISKEFNASAKSVFDQIKGQDILLVTEEFRDDRFIMINFEPADAQTLTFKLNRANIINQGLKVLPKMILLGGSDVDVAGLYLQAQDSVQELEVKMLELQSRNEIREKSIELEKQKKIITRQENEIEQKQEIIYDQQKSLDNLLAKYSESESGLKDNINRLAISENELTRLQNEIDNQTTQIQDGKLILEEQFRLIKEQDDLIRDKESSLDEMGSSLNIQSRKILLLIIFTIVILFFLVLLMRAYRIRKKQTQQLSRQKDELSNLLLELREAQSQLVQSEKMASLGVLTAGIAHEINNAINFVVSGIYVLEKKFEAIEPVIKKVKQLKSEDKKLKEKVESLILTKEKVGYNNIQKIILEVVKNVKIGAERTTTIVKGLRSFSRSESEEIGKIDIHQDIEVALLLLQNRHRDKIEIEKDFNLKIPEIDGYSGQMGQVFLNIIGNAIDAFEENQLNPMIKIRTELNKKGVLISIKDNGSGIDEDVLDKIFDPFFTTKKVGLGTGLGLSITYGIIEKHKGDIKVKSKKNTGTEFIIRLPLKID
jgi:signal transduction histidine kinase